MSSHHVVREKQEPALLIAGVNGFDDELLGQLLEWSPTVIVTDATAETVQSLGIHIDWLVADEPMELYQSDVKVIKPDGNAVISALERLIDQGYQAVNIIIDEFDQAFFSHYVHRIDLIIFFNSKKITVARSGFSKWSVSKNRLEFLTVPHHFVYTNLSILADNYYEITRDGVYTLQFSDDFYLYLKKFDSRN